MFGQSTPVLVNEDTIYRESRKDHSALLFFRKASASAAVQQFIFRTPPPPAFLFQDQFLSVYPVLEAYSQAGTAAPSPAGVLSLFVGAYRPPEIEGEYSRANHQKFFEISRHYGFITQMVGFTFEQPDFCDDPWIEWIHPKASDESALFPFRQIPSFIRGQQFNLFYGQPQGPRLDPEPDTIRPFDYGVFPFRQSQAVPQILTSCGEMDAYDYMDGAILLAWGPFGGPLPDSYNVYVNGVFNQSVPNPLRRLAVITGLFATSYAQAAQPPQGGNSLRPQSMPPSGVVTPATTYVIQVRAVSAGVEVSPSAYLTITDQPTTQMLTTQMKRPFPFPNTGSTGA